VRLLSENTQQFNTIVIQKKLVKMDKALRMLSMLTFTQPESPSKYENKYTKTYEKKNFELPSKTYLKRNVKSFHENVRHKCEKCDKGFSLKGHLKTHIQSAHENVYKEGQFECTHKKCT